MAPRRMPAQPRDVEAVRLNRSGTRSAGEHTIAFDPRSSRAGTIVNAGAGP